MTVNVAGRRGRASKTPQSPPSEAPPVATGEIQQTVFSCPACNRPLAMGSRRCPGCGSRLLMGVQASRASVFLGIGLMIGLGFGIGTTSVAMSIGRDAREAEIAAAAAAAALATVPTAPPAATQPPLATPTAGTGTGTGSAGTAGVPAIAKSAVGQAVALDERLATSASALAAAAAAPAFDTVEVAAILRTLSADAVFGQQLAKHIAAWDDGAELAAELGAFYTAIQQTAAEGMTASIRNEAAYRAAADRMLEVLVGLDALHLDVQAAAAEIGASTP